MKALLNRFKWIYLLLFGFIFIQFAFINVDDDVKVRSYRLPIGVTSKDYLPNTLIIKYRNVALQRVKTFGNDNPTKNPNVKITFQKPLIKSGVLAIATFADQQKIEENGLNRIYEIGYQSELPIEKAIEELLKDESIEYAEPSFIYYTFVDPDDTDYLSGKQNYLAQVKASEAWNIQPNSNGVVIAIVDSGSDLQHLDLSNNIYRNPIEVINGLDDDNDGYIDNYQGWDFVGSSARNIAEDNNPDVPADSLDHGIHVSGLASAVTNNGTGISSIAQTAKLMILKVGSDDNARAIYRGYDGIIYAANHGAKIINCSWGGPGGGAFGQDVINYAVSKNCLVVVAAGNGGNSDASFPAAYNGAFAVANVRSDDVKATSSSFGFHVSISAPGSSIYSTINRDRYGIKTGTSMAAPIVSSAAALVMSKFPTLTGIQVGELLRLNTDDIYNLPGNNNFKDQLGNGRLNVFKALTATNTPSIRKQKITIINKSQDIYAIGDTLNYFFELKNVLQPSNDIIVKLTTTDINVSILNNTITTGVFASSETKVLGPFKVVVKSGTPDNQSVFYQLSYSSSSSVYQDKEYFTTEVNLDYQNITVNKINTTITSIGKVGYSGENATKGLGFLYKNYSLLFEAGLMIGNATNKVSNNVRSSSGGIDANFYKVSSVKQIVSANSAYEGQASFRDLLSPSPLNIDIINRQIAYKNAPDDKYVIVEYEVINKNQLPLNNIFIGLFTDWDIDEGSKNLLRYDEGLRMGYTYASTPLSPYAGVKLLSGNATPLFYPLSYQIAGNPLADANFSLADKYQTLSSGIQSTSLGIGDGIDVMYVIGNGPYNIPANSSVKLAFAFIAGDNLSDISISALAAQAKYAQVSTAINPDGTFAGFDVSQNFPNPVKDKTSIIVQIPNNGKTSVEVYDLTGRKVLDVLNQELRKGTYTYEINASDLNSGIYFYKTAFEGQEKTLKMLVQK